MKVLITKYTITKKGIIECEADLCLAGNTSMIHTEVGYFWKPDWHTTLDEAKSRVLVMIDNRIKNLEKDIDRLRKIQAEFDNPFPQPLPLNLE